MADDNVNSPAHYLKGKKETIDVIKDCMNKRKTNQIDFLESLGTPQYKYENVVIARFPQENLDS